MDTKKLRQKILDLAIHGKLVPQDPNDEPASVLLERIRAEKEALIKEGKIKRTKKTTASDTSHYENVPFEVPEGWCWCRLDSICTKIVDGDHNPPSGLSTPSNYKMLSSKNVNFDTIVDLEDCRYLSHDDWIICNARTNLHKGDILLTTVATLGRSCVVETTEQFCFQRSVTILTTSICNKYLKYVFDSDFYQEIMSDGAKGTAQKGFYLNQVEHSFIPVPPLAEQKKIAKEIEKWLSILEYIEKGKNNLIDAICAAKSKVLDLAIHGKLVPQDPSDEPASELLKRINPKATITGDNPHYTKLPQGWCLSKIGLVAKYTNGRAFKPEEWESDGLPIIRIQNLNDTEAKYNYSSSRYEAKYLVQSGDLLFAWAASLGAFIWEGPEAWLNQHIFKVEPYEMITKEYLFYFFLSMIDSFYNNSHGSGMVHITKNVFEDIDIPIPPITEQKRIVTTIETLFRQLQMLRESLQA